jgi:hypothetical protein
LGGASQRLADKHKQQQRKAASQGGDGGDLGFFGLAFALWGLGGVYHLDDGAFAGFV